LPTANLAGQLTSRNRSSFAEMALNPGFTTVTELSCSIDRGCFSLAAAQRSQPHFSNSLPIGTMRRSATVLIASF
jgi:hypothetical protein